MATAARPGDSGAARDERITGTDPIPILKAFTGLRQVTALYPHNHTIVQQAAAALYDLLQPHLAAHGAIRLDVIEGDVHVDGEPCRLESAANPQVVRDFLDLGLDSVHVTRGVDRQELQTMAEVLLEHKERPTAHALNALLAARGVTHVNPGRLIALDTRWRAYDWPDAPTNILDPAYAESLRLAQDAFQAFESGRGPAADMIREILHLLVSQVIKSHAALGQILALKEYENHTYCHSVNVAIISLLLGRRLGLSDSMLEALVEGALLHDVGKTRVPVEILRKPGALDRREWEIVRRHPVVGASLLLDIETLSPLAATIALEHHRHHGGGGYPDLGDEPPHLLSQIVAVADTYEAMTGARAYRAPAAPEHACLILARVAGRQLNPFLVKAFVSAVTFFPIGTRVRTSRGERGIVVRTNPAEPLHPVILVGEGPSAVEIDTSRRDASGAYERHIVETLRANPC
ncbi:MAG TPA: HD domain-containing phosphohydrolase [Vicinamibacterales bacterium]|nr:HD domain-containing phosphohydrolase [Vicinamibacterales bacterium]